MGLKFWRDIWRLALYKNHMDFLLLAPSICRARDLLSDVLSMCCGPIKGPEERHELEIMWNKYIECKYKYSIGKSVLNISLTAKMLGWS